MLGVCPITSTNIPIFITVGLEIFHWCMMILTSHLWSNVKLQSFLIFSIIMYLLRLFHWNILVLVNVFFSLRILTVLKLWRIPLYKQRQLIHLWENSRHTLNPRQAVCSCAVQTCWIYDGRLINCERGTSAKEQGLQFFWVEVIWFLRCSCTSMAFIWAVYLQRQIPEAPKALWVVKDGQTLCYLWLCLWTPSVSTPLSWFGPPAFTSSQTWKRV